MRQRYNKLQELRIKQFSRRIKMTHLQQLRFPSKYLVEEKSFFSTTQYILLLQENELQKFSMEKDNKQPVVESYTWQMLLDVQVSQRAPTEFQIDVLPMLSQNMRPKERIQLIQSASKATTCSQMVLHCAERDKLVAEIKHIIHMKNFSSKPLTQLTCWQQTEITEDQDKTKQKVFSRFNVPTGQGSSQNNASYLCKVKLYPTAIHMVIDRQSGRRKKQRQENNMLLNPDRRNGEMLPSQNAMGSLLVSGIGGNDAMDTTNMMDSRMIMGGSGEDEDEVAVRGLFKTNMTSNANFLASRPFQPSAVQGEFSAVTQEDLRAEQDLDIYNNQIDEEQDEDYIGFGDDRQDDGIPGGGDGVIMGHGAQITTYGANFDRNENPKLKEKYCENAIYLNELTQVLCQEKRLISMVKENQEIEQIIFKDDDSLDSFLDQLQNCFYELMKRPLQIVRLHPGQSVRSKVDFLNWPGTDNHSDINSEQTCFKVDVNIVLDAKVNLPNYSIQLDSHNIYLVSCVSNKPTKQMPLVCLQILRVVDDSPTCNLMLTFEKDVQIDIKAASYSDRERLISSILMMRNLAVSDRRGIASLDNLKVFQNRSVDFSHKIQAYSATQDSLGNFSQSQTHDYESGLIRKLSELMNPRQTMQLDNVIDEILLNATFCYINKIPESYVKVIMTDFYHCFQDYYDFEEQKSDLIDQLMQKGSLPIQQDAVVNFLGKLSPSQVGAKSQLSVPEESMLFKNERHQESLKNLKQTIDQTIRYLNVLKSLLNSRVFMQEMANYEGILQILTLLLISKNPIIAQLAAQVIKAACHHHSGSESKLEKANKRVLFRGSLQSTPIMRGRNQPQKTLLSISTGKDKNRNKNGHFFEAIFEYMRYFEELYDCKQLVKSLHLTSINHILSSILQERYQSTSPEDLQAFALMVSRSDMVMDDRASNKPIFQLFDKFCLLDHNYFDIQYMFTMMLSQSLNYFFESEDTRCLGDIQGYILTYSIQFIWHLYLLMTSKIMHQRTHSIKLLARLLTSNRESHDLLLRILPVTLFHKVKANRQNIESLQWNFPQWVEFFTQIVPRNFNSATEQWNNETRTELTNKLLAAKCSFMQTKELNLATITSTEARQLLLPIHEFSQGKLVTSSWKNLKWNYREFEVEYDCLASEYLVGRYFLTRLLILQPGLADADEFETPQLTMQISEPSTFWHELLMQFMASYDEKQQKIIIMTLCVLYRQEYDAIGEMKTIPYWLKLIEHPEYSHVHFLLLQLVYVALSFPVRTDLAKTNTQVFIKAKGFHVLHNCMNLVFKDLRTEQDGEEAALQIARQSSSFQMNINNEIDEENKQGLTCLQEALSQKEESNIVNFTGSSSLSRYFKRNSLNICKGILALRIIDQVFTSMQFQYHLPMPTNYDYMLQEHALATLAQMTLLQNTHLNREVLLFIEKNLSNHFSLYKLKHSGLIEFLILALDTRNGERALQLLIKLQAVCISFNNELDFSDFNSHDLQMVREDKEQAFDVEQETVYEAAQPNLDNSNSGIFDHADMRPVLISPSKSDPTAPLFDETYLEHKRMGKRLPQVLESILLRYLPTPFIKFLFERDQKEFLSVYRMEEYFHPILIWNREQRELLEQRITQTAQSFIAELKNFANDSSRCKKPTEIPIYKDSVGTVVKYPMIEREVRCGRYYLNVWTNQAKVNPAQFYQVPVQEEEEFHLKIKEELLLCIEQEEFKDCAKIITLLKSCHLALKKFTLKRIQSLSEIKKILVHVASTNESMNKIERKMILLTGVRIIAMAIDEDQINKEEILQMGGVQLISDIIDQILSSEADPDLDSNGLETDKERKDVEPYDIDRIDAKTLNLCVESITTLVNEDIEAFMEFSLEQRIKIFGQMSKMLDLSFSLFSLLEKRRLKPFKIERPAQDQRAPSEAITPSPVKRSRTSVASMHQQFPISGMEDDFLPDLEQSPSIERRTSVQSNSSQQQTPVTRVKARGGRNPDYDYSKRSLLSIIEDSKQRSNQNRPDAYSVCLIFNITSSIFRLMKSVAVQPLTHPELIASGLFWRTIQHCFFDLTENEYRRSAILKAILRDCILSLKLLVTFIDKFMKCRPEEQLKFHTITGDRIERRVLDNFHECIKKLFTAKILDKLCIQFVITRDMRLEYTAIAEENQDFLRLFSTQQLQSPELVWNNETRAEMQEKLRSQIHSMNTGQIQEFDLAFCNEIKDFEYTVNLTELRIQGIFVKYFNEQCRQGTQGTFSRKKLAKFANQIIEKLEEFASDPSSNQKNIRELVEAFKNLIVNLNLVIKSELDFDHFFETLCNLIQLQNESGQADESQSWDINEVEKRRLLDLSSHVIEIIRTLVQRRLKVPRIVYQQPQQPNQYGRASTARLSYRSSTQLSGGPVGTPVMIDMDGKVLSKAKQDEEMNHLNHGNYLLKSQPFFRLLVRIIYQREIQVVPFKEDVIPMIHEMIAIPNFVLHLFIDRGLIMFLLNLIFDTQCYQNVISKQMRGTLTDQVLKIDRVMQSMDRGNLLAFSDRQSFGVVKAFIPPSFFAEMNERMWRMRTQNQNDLVLLQMQFLDNFDADYFENALVKWDKSLREMSQRRVKDFCERLQKDEPIQELRQLEQIVNIELEKEERIIEVILRNYNHNPAVFINTKLNIFITEVTTQLFTVSQQIYTLRQDDTEGQLKLVELKRKADNPERMTEQQRKFKYLSYQAQLMLSALLLSLEQLLYNEYNPNLLQTRQDRQDEKMDAQARLTTQLIQRTTDIRQVEEKVFKCFNMWMQYPVFLDDELSEHIRITFLQTLFLIIDVPTSMQYFKKTEVPLDFLSKQINRVFAEGRQDTRIIEDTLVLLVTQKMLRVDLQYTCPQLALKNTLDQLVQIALKRKILQRYIKQILQLISQNTHYQTNVNDVLERNNGSRQDLDRMRSTSNADFFNQVWRNKPTSGQNARAYYEWSETHTINRTLFAGQLDKLPILSPESVQKIKYGFLPDNLREYLEGNHSQITSTTTKLLLRKNPTLEAPTQQIEEETKEASVPIQPVQEDQDESDNEKQEVMTQQEEVGTDVVQEQISQEELSEYM